MLKRDQRLGLRAIAARSSARRCCTMRDVAEYMKRIDFTTRGLLQDLVHLGLASSRPRQEGGRCYFLTAEGRRMLAHPTTKLAEVE